MSQVVEIRFHNLLRSMTNNLNILERLWEVVFPNLWSANCSSTAAQVMTAPEGLPYVTRLHTGSAI